jgi:hypothetical protein
MSRDGETKLGPGGQTIGLDGIESHPRSRCPTPYATACPYCVPDAEWQDAEARAEADRLRTALLSVAAFSKHPHPAPCGTDSCVLCLIESACAEALGDSA